MALYIDEPKISDAGEACVAVEFADEISDAANVAVQALRRKLGAQKKVTIVECTPAYSSLSVFFDPLTTDYDKLIALIKALVKDKGSIAAEAKKTVHIPVCYDGDIFAPDLAFVAQHAGLSKDEVIRRHSAKELYCYMLGFVPGFAYLGGMDASIAAPRLASPRISIPAGSVGIAGAQTGIYPIESPGGWQLIGRTPLRLFAPLKNPPSLIDAGYYVKFEPISEEEYEKIAGFDYGA